MAGEILHLDFETRSCADLRKVGLHVYAADPTTDVLCAAYAFDDGPISLWAPGQPAPYDLLDFANCGGEIWAHNAAFEIEIWNVVCKRRYGWYPIRPEKTVCTMAMAYAMGLPGSLDGCAAALGITERKDLAGGRLMLQLSKPKTIEPLTWWEDEERLSKLYDYCRQDIVVERAAGKRMLRLSPYERRVYNLDWKINQRGIQVDVHAVKRAIELVEGEKVRLNAEMRAASDNQIATCTAVQQIKDYLEFFGVSGEALDKAAVAEHLTADLPPAARRILELRAEAGKASTSKFAPMAGSAGADGRLRGMFQYSGANTRRWAGRRVQLHNLLRGKLKPEVVDAIITDLLAGASAEELSLYYGSPLAILGDCTRSFLMAAPGKELLVADFAAIEARVLAWLAGQEDVLNVFRDGKDIYKVAASQIFGVPASAVTDAQRQVGKVAILALGYGGGVGAFQTMAKGYGVKMEPAFMHLLQAATPEQRIRAQKTWESNRNKPAYEDISEREFIASDLTKIFWRENNPRITAFWEEIEIAAISAVEHPGQFFGNGKVQFRRAGSFLWCRLPSGGVICYPYPEIKDVKTPWGSQKRALTYMSEDGQTRKWQRFSTYGGSLAENCLSSETLVLTSSGWRRVAEVRSSDLVFDGLEWVAHGGLVCQGEKETGEWLGVRLTGNHLILAGKKWKSAILLDEATTSESLILGLDLVPWWLRSRALAKILAPIVSAIVELKSQSAPEPYSGGLPLAEHVDMFAQELNVRRPMDTLIFFPIPNFLRFGGIATRGWYPAVIIKIAPRIKTTVAGGLAFMPLGWRIVKNSFDTLKGSPDGTILRWIWTAGITPKAIPREIYGWLHALRIAAIGAILRFWFTEDGNSRLWISGNGIVRIGRAIILFITTCGEEKPPNKLWRTTGIVEKVYDIKNCGPRNRFVIMTNGGPAIVHNCTQAVARDLLADAMLRLDEKGFSIVAHIHDEIICEMPKGVATLQDMIAVMVKNPTWAAGLPLKATGFVTQRYRK